MLSDEELEAVDGLAAAAGEFARKAAALFLLAMRSRAVSPAAATTAPALLTKAELAKRLGVSTATVDRLRPPSLPVGAHDRYDLETVRAALAARGKRPTTSHRRAAEDDTIDVSSIARSAGLRAVGGRS